MLGEHARATAETFGKQTAQLNQVLANNSAIMQQTANQVGTQSKEAVSILTSQTQTLREVSRGLLDQIHGLTQRFENQGQAILTAAKALDSSNTKIDFDPGRPASGDHRAAAHGQHQGAGPRQHDALLCGHGRERHDASGSAGQASRHRAGARHGGSGASGAASRSSACATRRKPIPQRAVGDLKSSFETVITQIGRQLEQMRGQFDNTSRGMRETAQKTASDLDSLRQEMQKRMEGLAGADRAGHRGHPQGACRSSCARSRRSPRRLLARPATPPQAPAPDPFRQARCPAAPATFQPAPANSISVRCRISMPGAGRSARRTATSDRSRAGSPVSSRTQTPRHTPAAGR